MNRMQRLVIFKYLDELDTSEKTATNLAKYVNRVFCLTWDECKKAVAQWQRQRGKAYSKPPVGKEYAGRFVGNMPKETEK